MSKSYSVPTKNRFATLDSDAEDVVVVKKIAAAQPEAAHPKRADKVATNASHQEGRQDRRPVEPTRGGRGGFRGGRGGFRGESSRGNEDETVGEEKPQRARFAAGSRGRGGPAGRGNREFDRHSGTGRGREMKKSGAGGHNWGSDGVEGAISGDNTTTVVVPAEEGATGEQTPVVDGTPEEKKAESEDDKFIDFAEWQKAQKQKRALLLQETTVTSGPVRSVDEADLQKDGYQVYKREETEEERVARELRMHPDESDSEEDNEDARPKTINLFEFTGDFGGRGRGGRGRGGRGRGGDRGFDRRSQAPVPVASLTDASAFPSLS